MQAIAHGGIRLALEVLLSEGGAFVVSLLPLRDPQLHLDVLVLDVKLERDEGRAAVSRDTFEFQDLAVVQKELSGPQRLVVDAVAVRVRADVAVVDPDLAVLTAGL